MTSPVAGPAPRVQTFASLRHRDFRLLWAAFLISSLGQQMRVMVRGWLVYELTESPLWLGVVSSAIAIPMIFVPFLGGIMADRIDRKKMLIYGQTFLMLQWFFMGALVTTKVVEVWHIFVLALISGTVQSLTMPAQQALIPSLVPRENLMNAISLNSAAQSTALIFGPFLGGLLVPVLGIDGVFYLTAAALIVVVWMLYQMVWEPTAVASSRRMSQDFREGLSFIRSNPIIFALFGMSASAFLFAQPYGMLMPVFAKDVLGAGAQGLGALMGASGVGALLGALVVASAGNFRRKGLAVIVLGITFSGLLLVFSRSTWLWLSLALMPGLGALSVSFGALNNTLLQMLSPDQLRGRMMGMQLVVVGLMPLGSLLIGGMAERLGTSTAVTIGAATHLTVLLGLLLLVPKLRTLG